MAAPELLLLGGMLFLIGLFRRLAHDIDLGENLVGPRAWRRNPQRAAEEQQRRQRVLGYLLMSCGAALFGVGLSVG